jgi:hypothetical protein
LTPVKEQPVSASAMHDAAMADRFTLVARIMRAASLPPA